MRAFLRKCRGILGTGVTFGAAWAAIFAALALIIGVVDPDSIDPGEEPIITGIGAMFGLIAGVLFGVLLSVAERRKTLRELSIGRAALWGALATAAYPLLTPVANSIVFFVCPIGAGLAAATVALAKKGELSTPLEQPKLPR